jgi:hypothetical protein
MESLISLLINLLILVVVLAVFYWNITLIIGAVGAPPMVLTVVQVIFALIILLYLLSFLTGSGPHFYRWR